MANYAVGDLQGCLQPLLRILDRVNFDPGKDQLWLLGDLVNRGPESLQTLRFIYSIRGACNVVLGNHDLHLLALANGVKARRKDADLVEIITAADAGPILDWLIQQPLARRDDSGRYLLSHAGVPFFWTSAQALAYSQEVEVALRSERAPEYFAAMYGNEPDLWHTDLSGFTRLRVITNYFTRMRCMDDEGRLHIKFKGSLEECPPGTQAWFDIAPTEAREETQLFGHWAALGGIDRSEREGNAVIGLDTGCVWGGCISMLNLDSREWLREHCP